MSSMVSSNSTPLETQLENVEGGFDVTGQRGEDNIIELTGDGNDGVIGGTLNDIIFTDAGDDRIFADAGDDIINAGSGNDLIRGGDGDDIIDGGDGFDKIRGGNGNDIIRSGLGGVDENGDPKGDVLFGGAGDDVFEFSAEEFEDGSVDKIMDFKADGFADTITISGVGEDGVVSYDAATGFVSINGEHAIHIGENQDVNPTNSGLDEDGNDTWELF